MLLTHITVIDYLYFLSTICVPFIMYGIRYTFEVNEYITNEKLADLNIIYH